MIPLMSYTGGSPAIPSDDLDVVVIGAGAAGLAAALALADKRVVVLEAEGSVGGRISSRPDVDGSIYWMNFGAHMMGGAGTRVGALTTRYGLEARPIAGRLMGMTYRGRRLLANPPELFPLLLPLSRRARIDLVRLGLALRLGSARYARLQGAKPGEAAEAYLHRRRDFEADRTLAQYVGPLGSEIATLFRAITERTGADPEEMTAGHGLRSFANVWSRHAPGLHLIGGTSLLAERMAQELGARVRTGCRVEGVRILPDAVLVGGTRHGESFRLRSRAVVLATPPAEATRLANDLPTELRRALSAVRFGPFITAGVLTNETGPAPWDDVYAVSTPGRSFSVMFNMASSLRKGRRVPGGSLMLFRGARGASELLGSNEREVERTFLADLADLFPEIQGKIRSIELKVWQTGAPYAYPGFAEHQDRLNGARGPVVLAGDYLEFPNVEAALASGERAAGSVRAYLEVSAR